MLKHIKFIILTDKFGKSIPYIPEHRNHLKKPFRTNEIAQQIRAFASNLDPVDLRKIISIYQ